MLNLLLLLLLLEKMMFIIEQKNPELQNSKLQELHALKQSYQK